MTWQDDVLGAGFMARSIPLLDDDLGPTHATLVRHDPSSDPLADPHSPAEPVFALLHLHGWNDYTHSHELPREIARIGGAFYGLDLRRYGRSLAADEFHGYIDSLSTYDEEIEAALAIIREEHGDEIDVVLMGHSTGGLTASLWAHRNPGAIRALILNAPWLETVGSAMVRTLGRPLVERIAKRDPTVALPLPEISMYHRILTGWTDEDGERPEDSDGDPFYDGWQLNPEWRKPAVPIRAGWLNAVVEGHTQVAEGLEISCPVLVLMSSKSLTLARWEPEMRSADTVLDVDLMAERAIHLGFHVTVVRIEDAIHDVFLSRHSARTAALREIERFAHGYILSRSGVPG